MFQRMTAKIANKRATALVNRDGADDEMTPPCWLVLVVLVLVLVLLLPSFESLLGAKGSGRPL